MVTAWLQLFIFGEMGRILPLCMVALAALLVDQAMGELLRVMVLAEPGSSSGNLDKASRFTYLNVSAKHNDRFAGFTIDVMNQVRATAHTPSQPYQPLNRVASLRLLPGRCSCRDGTAVQLATTAG